jgi:esterase/lipase superfamily enzyme
MQSDNGIPWQVIREFAGIGLAGCAIFTGLAFLYISFFTPLPYAGVKLQKDVVYVSSRRFEANGLEVLSEQDGAVALAPFTGTWSTRPLASSVTLLVHGYNTQEHKIAGYFAGLAEYLMGPSRYTGSIVVFDWPSVGIPFDELTATQRVQRDMQMMVENSFTQPGHELANYLGDKSNAETTGATSLLALLDALASSGVSTVDVVAHSMGCHLVMHAMQQRPDAFSGVRSMVWLAPDVHQAAVGEPWFRAAVDKLRHGLSVHYSNNDTVLTQISQLANLTRRLGATGPGPQTPPHEKIEFVDMTAELGTEGVHTGYLLRDSASARLIAARLAERD